MINERGIPSSGIVSVSEVANTNPNRFLKVIVFVATIGAIAFGYDTGVIAGALPFMVLPVAQGGLDLTALTEGIVTSSLIFGAAGGAFFAGRLSDKYGRRKALLGLALIFFIGAIGTSMAPNIPIMVFFRAILGLAVGGSSAIVPMFIAEIAPAEARGPLVSQSELMIVSGQLLAYTSNAILASHFEGEHGIWRYMLAIAALPAALLFIGMMFMPESPRWLANNGYFAQAKQVLLKIRERNRAHDEFNGISEQANVKEESATFKDLSPFWIRRLIYIGAGLGCVSQFTGVNSVMYFAPTILLHTGLSTKAALIATITNGVISVIATILGMNLLAKKGRRGIMITGIAGIVVMHALMGLVFRFPSLNNHSYIVLAVMLGLLFFVQCMVSTVYWIMMSTIFPMHVRGLATGIAVAVQWIANGLVTLLFPSVLQSLGGDTFFIFAAINFASLFFVIKYLPETKGKSLEMLEAEFKAVQA